jgi:hypothetical protein
MGMFSKLEAYITSHARPFRNMVLWAEGVVATAATADAIGYWYRGVSVPLLLFYLALAAFLALTQSVMPKPSRLCFSEDAKSASEGILVGLGFFLLDMIEPVAFLTHVILLLIASIAFSWLFFEFSKPT